MVESRHLACNITFVAKILLTNKLHSKLKTSEDKQLVQRKEFITIAQ